MRIDLAADEPLDHDLDDLERLAEKECGVLCARLREQDRLGHQVPEREQRADQQRLIERKPTARNGRVTAGLAHSLSTLRTSARARSLRAARQSAVTCESPRRPSGAADRSRIRRADASPVPPTERSRDRTAISLPRDRA